MVSRRTLLPTVLSLLLPCVVSFPQEVVHASDRPNIVLIFADDLGYGDVGCFNKNCPFETPHLDQMATEGAKLTSFYVPTPYCAPSRGTILTGRYPFRHTVMRNPSPDSGASNFGLPHAEVTLAELLKTAGYATAAIGKWHLGHRPQWLPRTQGFDEYYGILYSNDMYPVQLVEDDRVVEYPVVQATLTKRYTQRALSFIERHRDSPFFLYLPYAMPHKPLAASDNFYTPETRDNLYADVIAELDAAVGRILAKLKQLGLDERTLVIFTSDNGPWYGGSSGGLRGMKSTTWEGGYRVPLIARMPGLIPQSVVNDAPAASIDVLPTVCRLAGVRLPTDRVIDGHDMMPLWKDSAAESRHEAIYGMHGVNLATIRSGKWKLHVRRPPPAPYSRVPEELKPHWIDPRGPDGVTILAPYEQPKLDRHPGLTTGNAPKPMMLFDLESDPGEQHDVAGEHPNVVQRLLKMFRQTEAEFPEIQPVESAYLFRPPPRGTPRPLMRLIGGDLRYDQIPRSQRHLLAPRFESK